MSLLLSLSRVVSVSLICLIFLQTNQSTHTLRDAPDVQVCGLTLGLLFLLLIRWVHR